MGGSRKEENLFVKKVSLQKPHTVKKPNHMEQVTGHTAKGTGRRDGGMRWDERTHEGRTEKGTSSRGSRAKPSQGRLPEVQGCSSQEAQRSRTQDTGGREACHRGQGPHAHTDTQLHLEACAM